MLQTRSCFSWMSREWCWAGICPWCRCCEDCWSDNKGLRTGHKLSWQSSDRVWDWAFQVALVVENPPENAGDVRDVGGFDPWIGKVPWRRKWQPTPVFLPGKSHGQRSLAGYSPWGLRHKGWTLLSIWAAAAEFEKIGSNFEISSTVDKMLSNCFDATEKLLIKGKVIANPTFSNHCPNQSAATQMKKKKRWLFFFEVSDHGQYFQAIKYFKIKVYTPLFLDPKLLHTLKDYFGN